MSNVDNGDAKSSVSVSAADASDHQKAGKAASPKVPADKAPADKERAGKERSEKERADKDGEQKSTTAGSVQQTDNRKEVRAASGKKLSVSKVSSKKVSGSKALENSATAENDSPEKTVADERVLKPGKQGDKASAPNLVDPKHYINRELSFLEFNVRVLALARDPNIPLLERMRYLCISCSNLDEFFEVRVAGLQRQLLVGSLGTGPDNMNPSTQLAEIRKRAHQLVEDQYALLNHELLPALDACEISFPPPEQWSQKLQRWAREFFEEELLPVLSPLGLAPSHPFPQLTNKSLNFIVSLKGKDAFGREATMAVVRAPRSLPRIIPVPESLSVGKNVFVLLSSMIQQNMAKLFPGLETQGVYQFRVTRNSDLYLADDDVADLRLALQDELNARDYGQAVRLETGPKISTTHTLGNGACRQWRGSV